MLFDFNTLSELPSCLSFNALQVFGIENILITLAAY